MEKSEVIEKSSKIFSSDKIYEHIYYNEFLEIGKLAFAFLLTNYLIRIFDITIFDFFLENKLLYLLVLITILVSITYISLNMFTYAKIENNKNNILQEYIDK